MRHEIERAIGTFSPKHAGLLRNTINGLNLPDIGTIARTVRETLEAENVHTGDFPNPFTGDLADQWRAGWEGEEQTDEELPDFSAMTKKQIDEWAAERGITLDRRLSKAAMIAALG